MRTIEEVKKGIKCCHKCNSKDIKFGAETFHCFGCGHDFDIGWKKWD